MITNVLIDFLLHWLSFLPGLILFSLVIYIIFSMNIFLWLPLLVYFMYIQVKLPSFKEIDYWTEIRENLKANCYLKSNRYKKVFQAEFENEKELKSEESKKTPRLFVWHPHGIQVISHIIHKIWTKSPLFPYISDTKTVVHSMTFQIPVIRELFLFYGCIPATKEYISHYLKKGISVNLFPGGVREMGYCHSDNKENLCYLRDRKGYLELAKDYEIVPVYTWGEQEFFTTSAKDSSLKKGIGVLNKIFGAICGYSADISAFELFNWRSFWKWNKVYLGVEKSMTYTFVGKSIKTDKSVEYIENLQRIYKIVQGKHKSDKKLIIH